MQSGWAAHATRGYITPCYLVITPEQAHERLGDAAMQNDQPERAKEEYGDARLLLLGLRDAGRLDKSDRRPALLCRHRALLYTPTWSLPQGHLLPESPPLYLLIRYATYYQAGRHRVLPGRRSAAAG